VARSVTSTEAPATTAPEVSSTRTRKAPEPVWASKEAVQVRNRTSRRTDQITDPYLQKYFFGWNGILTVRLNMSLIFLLRMA
jgi:hypothetical protein